MITQIHFYGDNNQVMHYLELEDGTNAIEVRDFIMKNRPDIKKAVITFN